MQNHDFPSFCTRIKEKCLLFLFCRLKRVRKSWSECSSNAFLSPFAPLSEICCVLKRGRRNRGFMMLHRSWEKRVDWALVYAPGGKDDFPISRTKATDLLFPWENERRCMVVQAIFLFHELRNSRIFCGMFCGPALSADWMNSWQERLRRQKRKRGDSSYTTYNQREEREREREEREGERERKAWFFLSLPLILSHFRSLFRAIHSVRTNERRRTRKGGLGSL